MSKKVGHLVETTSNKTGEIGYTGEIDVANITGQIALSPVENRRSENAPHYDLMVKTRHGWKSYGAAWRKQPVSGGEEFLSITVDHELMAGAVYVAAFPPSEDADEGRWNIVWGRPRGGAVAAAGDDAPVDDEIPF